MTKEWIPPTLEEKLESERLSKIRDQKLGFVHKKITIPIYKNTSVPIRKDMIIQFNKDTITTFKKDMVIPNREDMTAPFYKNLRTVKCPNCESNEAIILSVLRNGNRRKCEDCGEIFVEWSKGINYIGNDEFNTWYGANKIDLYNIAEKLVEKIGEVLSQKDYSDDYKIVAANIIVENMESLCTEWGIKDLEEEISAKLRYRARDYRPSRKKWR